MTLADRFGAGLERLLGSPLPNRIGLAVSGGSDSTALLTLTSDWARDHGITLHVATVDHGLRPEAGAEAAEVAALSAGLAATHDTLNWRDWQGQGNLQDAARRARYRLLGDWAEGLGLDTVLLGHTRDDNVECLIMGLSRGAGLDGLSGMRPVFHREDCRFVRPMLDLSRQELREHLRASGVGWCDDPSNQNPRFARVRVREALAVLDGLGLTQDALAHSIANLRSTRAGLNAVLRDFCQRHVTQQAGDLIIAPDAFANLPDEVARRFLNAALRWVSGSDYPPRSEKVVHLMADADARRAGMTLHGCLIRTGAAGMRISREPEAVVGAQVPAGAVWDGRWRIVGPVRTGMTIRCLGTLGLADRPDWRASKLPRSTCLSSPAVWDGSGLVAAPMLDGEGPFQAVLVRDFSASL